MSTPYELTASLRERTGKGAARATRREGKIPGVIYGGNEPPVAVKLDHRQVERRILAGGFLTTLGTIDVDGSKVRVMDIPLHVDFLRVSADSRLALEIPVHFVNETASPGIKRGGVLNIVRHTIELYCPADHIPEFITADLTGLDINDSLHISHIALPEGVRPTVARDFTVATIAAPAGIKEELRGAAAAAAAPVAVEGTAPAADAKKEGGGS
jgi:large subunit ribosomal protein L25